MRGRVWLVSGIVLILLGIGALIRPNIEMPAKREEVHIQQQRVLIETRRIVSVPRLLSGLLILGGAGLIFLGTRRS
ncbi:MAG: hypothetical protein ACRD4C_14025 [Candidatus Acidiferrales bacterium]